MATATKSRSRSTKAQNSNVVIPPKIQTPPVTAYAVIKAPIGDNLWQLVTYTIQNGAIVKTEKSVEDLREILIAKVTDLVGGLQ